MTDVINSKQLEDVFKSVDANTKFLVDASAANERSSASLELMQVGNRYNSVGLVPFE